MIKSMTAYSRSSRTVSHGTWVLELHCVNRKALDFNIYLPKELLYLDITLRKAVSERIQRGQVTLRVSFSPNEQVLYDWKSQLDSLKFLKKSWEKIALELGYDSNKQIDLCFLTSQLRDVQEDKSFYQEPSIKLLLEQLVDEALVTLIEMKQKEGDVLAKDVRNHLQEIKNGIDLIEKRSSQVGIKIKERLKMRLDELKIQETEIYIAENEERLARELIFYADKFDISEELVRLHAHLERFNESLEENEKSIGRTLEFLVQEINREANTIGSKSPDFEISSEIIAIKSRLEKIREQIQNIE